MTDAEWAEAKRLQAEREEFAAIYTNRLVRKQRVEEAGIAGGLLVLSLIALGIYLAVQP